MVLLDLVRLIPSQVQSSQVRAPFFIHDTKKRESPRLGLQSSHSSLDNVEIIATDSFGIRRSVAEAATLLGVPEGTIKSRCARGRLRLAETLGHLRSE